MCSIDSISRSWDRKISDEAEQEHLARSASLASALIGCTKAISPRGAYTLV
jgi:hypothetical protein